MWELTFKEITFRDHKIWVAQDSHSSEVKEVDAAFYGNKAWKLDYYLTTDFPGITKLISYGSAQSNMLYSLSVLAKLKGWSFDFYVNHIASHLKDSPRGNYAAALNNGARIIEFSSENSLTTERFLLDEVIPNEPKVVFIPEGGRSAESEQGIEKCAEQILRWVSSNGIENPKLMLPSGTGTTALFLQKHLPFDVITCACVGSAEYLTKQFLELESNTKNHPKILPVFENKTGKQKKFHFGKLYREFYFIWQELLKQTGVEFDLLYDPMGWLCLEQGIETSNKDNETYLYLHQGGLKGNETMRSRYNRLDS